MGACLCPGTKSTSSLTEQPNKPKNTGRSRKLPSDKSTETDGPKPQHDSFLPLPSRHGTSATRRSGLSTVSLGQLDTPQFVQTTHTFTPIPKSEKENMNSVKFKLKETILLPKKDTIQDITSSVILDDNRIVLCDRMNGIVSLFDKKFHLLSEVRLNENPKNIAYSAQRFRIAATIPDKGCIQYINIVDNTLVGDTLVKLNENIERNPMSGGVEFIGEKLFYTSGCDVIVFDMNDPKQKKKKFEYAFRNPVSLFVDRESHSLFVTCDKMGKKRGEVVKMNFEKDNKEFTVAFPNISRPVCSAVDRCGNIYVCDIEPYDVFQISPDGQNIKEKLDLGKDVKIQHINFFPTSDMFIATELNSDKIKLYELE